MKDLLELMWGKLGELKFFGNVIKEFLWLYFLVILVVCVVKENDVIGGYEILKGIIVFLGIDIVYYLIKFWKDFYVFDL